MLPRWQRCSREKRLMPSSVYAGSTGRALAEVAASQCAQLRSTSPMLMPPLPVLLPYSAQLLLLLMVPPSQRATDTSPSARCHALRLRR
jgi:hypothetical protein